MYRTVIVEDDPVITLLNRRYIEKDERFCVVQTFSAAHPALFWLRSNPVDLIILDVYMPQMNGLELLRMLRAEGVDSDVIMVTSANDAETIEALMRLGVTDYLIKPFGLERFQLALDTFCNRKNAIHDSAQGAFTQNKLDRALLHISAPVSQTKSAPPKRTAGKNVGAHQAVFAAKSRRAHLR